MARCAVETERGARVSHSAAAAHLLVNKKLLDVIAKADVMRHCGAYADTTSLLALDTPSKCTRGVCLLVLRDAKFRVSPCCFPSVVQERLAASPDGHTRAELAAIIRGLSQDELDEGVLHALTMDTVRHPQDLKLWVRLLVRERCPSREAAIVHVLNRKRMLRSWTSLT